jgi:LysR family glycine cleavage system transcriptional activator
MKRSLPPLLSLRAFEAAARHMSFTLAADELCITQSAVSRHVKNLEDHYRLKLFNRLTREIELTEEGLALFNAVCRSFDQIEEASRAINKTKPVRGLILNILPTLASTWLMPRLVRFTQLHQNIEVRLVTSIDPVAFDRDKVDVAIRVGKLPGQRSRDGGPRIDLVMTNDWKGLVSHSLFPDVLVPVCSPNLLSTPLPVSAALLPTLPLIHTDSRAHAWEDWFNALRIPYRPAARVLHFGHFFMSVRAAMDGKGIALVPSVLVTEDVDAGRLVIPVAERVLSDGDYYLLFRKDRAKDRAISAFCDWLLAEVGGHDKP